MNYINLVKIAINALKRNKMRAFLTMLGIIIGVGSVIAMIAIGQGSKKSIQDQVSSMGANLIMVMPASQSRGGIQLGNSSSQSLTIEDVKAIKAECQNINMISPEVRSSGQIIYSNKNTPSTIYGGDVDYAEIKKRTLASGRMYTAIEVKSAAKVCIVGKTIIKNLFGNENFDAVGQTIRFKGIPLRVVGILTKKGENSFGQDQDDLLLAPYTTVQKRILAIPHIQGILASAISEEKSSAAVSEMESVLRVKHKLADSDDNDFNVRSQQELVQTFSSISNVLTMLLGAIAGISLLVGGIGIMNIMYVSVTERTREIGLRMAIGARGKDILLQFLTESILLSVIGGVIGILLGIGASSAIAKFMKWPVVVMPNSVILSFLVCATIGVFFGWYPARKASNLDPIDALRYE